MDHAAVWQRFCDYVEEDFAPERVLGRVKIFTAYFSRNFLFGHTLFTAVQAAPSLAAARERNPGGGLDLSEMNVAAPIELFRKKAA